MERKQWENISNPIPAGIFETGRGGRKCLVGDEEAYFHGVFQLADTVSPSPMVGGDPGGQIAYPVAVVEKQDGTLTTVALNKVRLYTQEVTVILDLPKELSKIIGEEIARDSIQKGVMGT